MATKILITSYIQNGDMKNSKSKYFNLFIHKHFRINIYLNILSLYIDSFVYRFNNLFQHELK